MKSSIFFFFPIFLFLLSCSSTKEISTEKKVKNISPKSLEGKLNKSELEFKWYTARAKINYSDGEFSQTFTANIRMRRDSLIWISLTGFLGMEGGRVLINKDSVFVIDRLNRQFHSFPFNYTHNYLPFAVSIEDVQNYIVGCNLLKGKEIQKVEINDFMYQCSVEDPGTNMEFWVNPKNYTYEEVRLKNKYQDQALIYKFGNYKEVDKQLYPHTRSIDIDNGNADISIDMDFSKIDTGKKPDFPFEVPQKYSK